jgi:hypothetical protein
MVMGTKNLSRLALSTLLGLTLAGTGIVAAHADQNTKDNDRMTDDEMMTDPAPLSYPTAAPGGLHLYHWSDYTKTELQSGSAEETRHDKMWQRERARREQREMMFHRTSDSAMTSDATEPNRIDPASLGYPHAAPGSLHLYHWKDYTRTEMASGSAEDTRRDKMWKMDKERMEDRKMRHNESEMDEEMEDDIDPMSLGYPHAAPGSLHLYHWKDYTRTEMASGSTEDTRHDKMHDADKKRKMDKKMRDSDSTNK